MNRSDKSGFSNWWFTVDRLALFCMLALTGIGLMLAFAASPAITGGPLTAGDFRYTLRQVVFAAIAVGILCGVSLLPPRQIKTPEVIPQPKANTMSTAVVHAGRTKRFIDHIQAASAHCIPGK